MKRIVLLLVLVAAGQSAAQVMINARLDTTGYMIGDWMQLHLEALHPQDILVIPPDPGEKLGRLDVISRTDRPPMTDGNMARDSWVLTLAAYDTGLFVIPPVEIGYYRQDDSTITSTFTDSIAIYIYSAGGDTLSAPHDIKSPVNIARSFADYVVYILIATVIIIAAVAYWWWKKRRGRRPEGVEQVAPEIAVDPYERAIKRLMDLKDRNLWRKGLVKDYYSELSEIVREFYEGIFPIPALEMTSEELLDYFTKRKDVSVDGLKLFLRESDLVKFAKLIPSSDDCLRAMEQSFSLVEEAKPVPQPALETPEAAR